MIVFSQNLWNEKKGGFEPGSLEIEKKRIKAMSFGIPIGTKARKKIRDYGKLFIGPSAIDLHVHSRDFEESHKETFETLDAAAQKGGVCVGACLANTRPRMDSVKTVDRFLKKASRTRTQFIPYASVTQNLEGKNPTDWNELLKRPTAGLSDDGKPILDSKMMESVLRATKKHKKLLLVHEEDTEISRGSVLSRSEHAMRLGIEGCPETAETTMVERDLQIASKLKAL